MLKRTFAALAIAAVTLLTIVATGSAASAADAYLYVYNTETAGGSIQHLDDGDHFRVKDLDGDGKGVRGYLLDANHNTLKSVYNGNGAEGVHVTFLYDVVAGRTYYLAVCLVDGVNDTTGRCTEKAISE